MDDAGTVSSCNKIAGNYAECITVGFNPRNELLIKHSFQLTSFKFVENLKGNIFVARRVIFKSYFLCFFGKIGAKQVFGKNYINWFSGVEIKGFNFNVRNMRSNGQRSI